MLDDDTLDKVQDLTTSLRATSEVLTTADRMLEHYRNINTDQDEEIRRVRKLSNECRMQTYNILAFSI